MKAFYLLLLPTLLLATNPGLKFGITEGTLVGSFILIEQYTNEHLSEVSLNDFMLAYDGMTISFSNVRTSTNINVEISDMVYTQPNFINVFLSKFMAEATFDYQAVYTTQTYTGSGSIIFESNDMSFSAALLASNGKPQLKIANLDLSLDSLAITTELSPSQNENLQNSINGDLESIQSTLTSYLYSEVTKLNTVLLNTPMLYPLAFLDLWVDLSLTGNSMIETDYLVIPVKGAVLNSAKEEIFPFNPSLLLQLQPGKELQIEISDYFAQSIASTIWGQFNKKITTLPAGLPIKLTTAGLGSIAPRLTWKYGKTSKVFLEVSQSKLYPNVLIQTAGSVTATIGVLSKVYVQMNSTYAVDAIEINSQFKLNFNLDVSSQTGSIKMNSITPMEHSVGYTTIGGISSSKLNKRFAKLISGSMATIDEMLKAFPVPNPVSNYFILTDDIVKVLTGCTSVEWNVSPS